MKIRALNLENFSKLIECLADQSRLRILHLLVENKTLYVGQIQEALGFTQTKTSRHLLLMKNAGLLKKERDDSNRMHYFINPEVKHIVEQTMMNLTDTKLNNDVKELQKLRGQNQNSRKK